MAISVTAMDATRPTFGALVEGVDIAAGVSPQVAAEIEDAIDIYGVLVFRDQVVDDDQQYAFSQHFGEMETATGDIARPQDRRLPMTVNDISNLDKDGNVVARDDRRRLFGLGNMLWHSDSSFKRIPSKFSLLSARTIPGEGGNTEFADMRAAWETLDPALQAECMDLICEHSQIHSRGKLGFVEFTEEERAKWAPVLQRLVRRHPRTGKLSLYLASHAGGIVGWPVPEARMFLMDLTEHATQRQFVYAHEWRQWDLVMWDNRVTMHRARRYDHTKPRDMHRTTVACEDPTVAEQAA
ncbi:TauD/TfdA family dioxygenase [Hwanghaeella grinnelliae]|uniref:TauD/TfdA family dioxygenase n=1 Tax=Hwanghaeella grinnelliae TaxID=2500179 RepID=A0A3S3URK6_9PROT|nr:TauD/TfdA family dioxygenase [Hwanghaeella grinnelliae]RVU38941.1 TauD/TfdA family dioxygenase [Hwanghaeella grinnelliae]